MMNPRENHAATPSNTMRNLTLVTAIVCILVGIYGYTQGAPNAQTGMVSKTALIPAWIGVAFLIAWLVSTLKPAMHKHAMHVSVLAALFGMFGACMPIKVRGFDFSQASVQGSVVLFLTCGVFFIAAIRSFIAARRNRG
jgi:cytosine/uracil/thiamine/allantoin permease